MNARWMGEGITDTRDLKEPGDIGIGAENYHLSLLVRCPVCHRSHIAAIQTSTGGAPVWSWDQSTLTLSPSYRTERTFGDGQGVCHWNLTNGVFQIHGDSTATPKPSE